MQTTVNTIQTPRLSGEHVVKATGKQTAFLRTLGYVGSPADLDSLTIEQASQLIETRKRQLEGAKGRILQTANLIDLAGRRVELDKESALEMSGPCPKCGGDDRFHVRREWFFCRHCHSKRGDIIEYTSWLEGVDYWGAIMKLDIGAASMPATEKIKPVIKTGGASAIKWDEPTKRQEALNNHTSLLAGKSKYAQMALEYLQGRCIDLDTVKAFKLGFDAVYPPRAYDFECKYQAYPKKPAIGLPWFNQDDALMCVKYRFVESHTYTDVDGKERTENKTSRGASAGYVFGWQALQGPDKCAVLIICEGEMNALSLWQTGRGMVDVLSAGSESTTNIVPTAVANLAKQYKHVVVWADKGKIADTAALSVGAASMRSPDGQDANDLLQAGLLQDLVSAMLKRLGVQPEPPSISDITGHKIQGVDGATEAKTPARPPLPRDLWRTGITDLAEAWRIWQDLKRQYATGLGMNGAGYYVATPDEEP